MAFFGGKDGKQARREAERIRSRTMGMFSVVVALAMGAVAYTDWKVEANVSLGYLYVFPMALSAFVNPLPVTIGLALLCTVLQDVLGPRRETMSLHVAENLLSLAGFLVVGFLVSLIARRRSELEDEVQRQRDEYERDLTLAAQVQRQVLPKPITLPGLEIAAAMHPARMLGGDYYDFFPVSDDVVDVVIADVSGKGAAAALLMPSLAVALRLRARELSGPAEIIKDLDGVLKQVTKPSTFVTMFYARLNHAERRLEYACGGHNPPLLVRPRTGESWMLEASGPIVGILEDAEYVNTVVALEPGDVLTLYTDGVSEQENVAEEQFSVERLKGLVLKNEYASAGAIVEGVAVAVAEWAGAKEQEDDLTVVVAKVR
ncbi:PP2C family protein-serine/threonine phosphatase [Edaphobacter aggregans]|uniref:PP2C family protein-serine/threonine phosphatase n=1 Tax=Edaphobacter aggregans TaxID=570835 RepID=UPI000550891B|nr:PP2C family protein-serine/threonine phosphatase [Edaphobacter aggregans]